MQYNKSLYPFESQWLTIDGQGIHYIDEGEGQVLLFSHAPLGSSFMFRNFILELRKHYRCIAFDYPGFGRSEDLQGFKTSIVSQSVFLAAFIQKLGLKNIIALGHDTGGPSLFKVAADAPKLFKVLILTDTIIFPTSAYPRIHNMLGIVGSRLFQSLNAWTNILVRLTFNFGVRTRKLSKVERGQYRQMFDTRPKRKRITSMLYSLRQNEAFMKEVQKGFEQQLNSMPTLLVYGELDPVTQLGIPQRIHQMLAHSTLYLIKNEGHFPHEGQASEMSQLIREWLLSQKNVENNHAKASFS